MPHDPPPGPAPFALALLGLPGVGRVTVHRLVERFPTYAALRATPREQVLLRLKGIPHADRTVDALFENAWADHVLAPAEAEVRALAERGIRVLAPHGEGWPTGVADLDRPDRPALLYAYGHVDALALPALAVLGRAGLDGDAFETAQAAVRTAGAPGRAVVTGAADGFDLAVQKVAAAVGLRSVAVLSCGLARLAPSFRPAATALVRAGGLLLSPFPMEHGPFEHDDRERVLLQAALGRVVLVASTAPGSAEARGAEWAAGAGRPIALAGPADGAPWAAGAVPTDRLALLLA